MEVLIDTKSVRENGTDIMALSTELSEVFEDMFNRLTSINTKTLEWYGDAANEYVKRINIEKANFMGFKDEIYSYGKYLSTVADLYDEKINENRRDEE